MKKFLPIAILLTVIAVGVFAQDATSCREALQNLMQRADSGEARAIYELAKLHDIGFDSIPVDSVKSTALYKAAAEKGYAPAMNFLGFRYYLGEIVSQDVDSALFWIRKAADQGDITAAANLGYLLADSRDVAHDEEEAIKWLTIAAEAGVNEAQLKLVDLMKETWKQLPPDSALSLGSRYYLGNAPIMGAEILQTAANAGLPKAQALLGDAFSKGFGVPYDHQKAIEYFYEGANGGDPSAQFVVGELLEIFPDALNSLIGEESSVLTLPEYWYDKAASQGVTDSETAAQKLLSYP